MKLLHCADIHLGYETHGRLDPATGLNTRLLDFKRSFDVMVARAVEEDVDAFVFAGDAYRTADPTPTQQKLFAEALRPVAEAGIPILMVVGNHDHPVSFGKASSVDIFGVLGATTGGGGVKVYRTPTRETIETKSGPLRFIAMPWPIRSLILSKEEHRGKSPHDIRAFIEERYADFIRSAAEEARRDFGDVPVLMAGHFSVQGAELSGSERASLIAHEPKWTVGQLAQPGIDYVALGHIHRYQDRNREAFERGDGPPVVYSSSIERISFKEHDAEKGFVLVDITAGPDGKTTGYTFVATPARRFVPIEADLDGEADPTAALLTEISRHDISDAVVRVRYRVPEEQATAVDVPAVRDALGEADTIAAIERVVDPGERRRRTTVRRDTSLRDAVERYVAQHEPLAKLQDALVAAAMEIEAEVDAAE